MELLRMEGQQKTDQYTEKERNLAELTKELVFLIRKLVNGRELYTKELNKHYHVSAAQLNSLLALHENGPLSPSQIARHIMVKSSTVTGVVDRLESKGLVRRLRNSPDRRVITIELTEAGERLAENAPPPIQRKIVEGLRRMPEPEIRKIVEGLKKLTNMLDVQDLEVD